jgi:peptidoglycan/xylan/chitin deacetylase (PgdA/CDA1 family)
MIVLNYHRVDDEKSPDFYTISPTEFSHHLNTILDLGLKAVATDKVLSMQVQVDAVMLHFDDATKGHYFNVAPQLENVGMQGVFFVPTGKIGGDRYLSVRQVQALAAKGHSIECHGHTHRRLDKLTPDDVETELATSVSLIAAWTGRRPLILAPPGGYFNDVVLNAAKRHGLSIIRTMNWNTNSLPIRDKIDCMVVTRSTSRNQIGQWAQGRGILWMKFIFQVKQMLRSILPSSIYLKIREMLGVRR